MAKLNSGTRIYGNLAIDTWANIGTIVQAATINAATIGNSGATLTGTISTAAQTNITSVGSLTALTINTANTAVDGVHVYSVNSATVSQMTLHATSGTVNRQSKLKFTGTFFNTPGDVGERYVTSIRSGFDSTSTAWGSEFLGIYVNNTVNDTGSDVNQRLIASFSNYAGVTASANVVPSANLTYNLGSTTAWWNNVYGVSVQAKYADLAEHYTADDLSGPGTVVVFGGEQEITTTDISHDTRVAGVISANPAYLMNAANPGLPVALTGRVPCLVQGPVFKGQVLVTSTTVGTAQGIDNTKFTPGCVVGKSLATINSNTIETIEVVVGRF